MYAQNMKYKYIHIHIICSHTYFRYILFVVPYIYIYIELYLVLVTIGSNRNIYKKMIYIHTRGEVERDISHCIILPILIFLDIIFEDTSYK